MKEMAELKVRDALAQGSHAIGESENEDES